MVKCNSRVHFHLQVTKDNTVRYSQFQIFLNVYRLEFVITRIMKLYVYFSAFVYVISV